MGVLLLLVSPLKAQTGLPDYAVVEHHGAKHANEYLASVNQLSGSGYRLMISGKFTILHLEATPPYTYSYLFADVEKLPPTEFAEWLNERGRTGYRWSASTVLLEKAPKPSNYEYRFAHSPLKRGELFWLAQQGYQPWGPVSFPHAIGPATTQLLFERDVDHPASVPESALDIDIQLAEAMRAGNVTKRVNELAKQGYRFLTPYFATSKGGAIGVSVGKCRDDCIGRYEYQYFDAKNARQLEAVLNGLGKDGFRVVPDTLWLRPHLVERDTHKKRTYSYRAFEPKSVSELEQQLKSAAADGFVPLGYVRYAGMWTGGSFLILEKEITASAGL